MSTADRVRRAINLDGRTQKEIAKVIGMDETALSKSLNGTREFSSYELASIASITGVTVYQLLEMSDPADEIIRNVRLYAHMLADHPEQTWTGRDLSNTLYQLIEGGRA